MELVELIRFLFLSRRVIFISLRFISIRSLALSQGKQAIRGRHTTLQKLGGYLQGGWLCCSFPKGARLLFRALRRFLILTL